MAGISSNNHLQLAARGIDPERIRGWGVNPKYLGNIGLNIEWASVSRVWNRTGVQQEACIYVFSYSF